MNILIVGNGFDLAHGLPTKYADFLKFIDFFYKHKAQESSGLELIAGEDINCYKYFTDLFNSKQDSEFDQYLYDQSRKTIHELSDLCKDNAWIKYFSEVYKSREQKGKDGWIDFESEISLIIQTFNSVSRDIQETIQKGGVGTVLSQRQLNVLSLFLEKMDSSSGMATHVWKKEEIDFWKQKLLEDLNKLTRALEIYLSDYISNFMLGNGLPDIKNLPYLDKILSFNYTCTYQRIYGEHPFLEFDYVHGKADLRNDIQSTNMVLGIDEYLEGDARDKDLEFIEFKKFFQRIHKETGGLYEGWLEEIQSEKKIYEISAIVKENGIVKKHHRVVKYHKVFIFGHSLDITDKDILRKFILNENVKIIIFYTDKEDYKKKIINLIKIIGQDELVKRTGGKNKTIVFQKINTCTLESDSMREK